MRPAAAFLLLLGLVLPGCASPAAFLAPAAGPPAPVAGGVALACPEGETTTRGDACVLRLADPLVQFSEPALDVHPADPRVMAVAAHAIGATGRAALVDARLFVTRDGGATWTRSAIPLPGPLGTGYSDPALAFAPDGTLHVTGMATHRDIPARIFHASTADDGATWQGPTVVSPAGARWDRPWVNVTPEGRVFLSWQAPATTSLVAWSDDGAAWTVAEPAPEGCFTASPVGFVRGEPWVGCYRKDEGLPLFRVDVEARRLVPAARAPLGCVAPRILAPPDGALLVTCYAPLLARSTDAGRSWSVVDVAALASVDDGWPEAYAYWSEVDARGLLHVQLSTFHRARDLVPDALTHLQGQPRRIAYVVLDPATGTLVHEARLADDAPESRAALPASLLPSLGDDWNGIAFAGNEGAMVWMNGGAVELTRVAPTP